MRNFSDLLPIPGDPYFSLEPMAAKYVARNPGEAAIEVSFFELMERSSDPSDVVELSVLSHAVGRLPLRVARAPDVPELGFCYCADEYPILEQEGLWCLILLNPSPAHAISVADLFLHELAHVFRGEEHDWSFLCILNGLRTRCGLPPSIDPYDVREGADSLDLPLQLQANDALIQTWRGQIGRRLAEAPNFPQSLRGDMMFVEAEVSRRRSEIASSSEFMALADELGDRIGAAPR
jgi:hypothetical protein